MKRALRNRLWLLGAVIALVAIVLWLGARDQRAAAATRSGVRKIRRPLVARETFAHAWQ